MQSRRGKPADKDTEFSVFLSLLLRHKPETVDLNMDKHGWVDISELITKVNAKTKHHITTDYLEYIVNSDLKGRYRFNDTRTRIKACQGHSIPWVEPEVMDHAPPEYLYHGTTVDAYAKIQSSGYISKMSRHAVHMHETLEEAKRSARRWHRDAVVLRISADVMSRYDYKFSVSENGIWLTERVPISFITKVIHV